MTPTESSPPPLSLPSFAAKFSPRAQIVALGCVCAGAAAFLYAVDPSRHAVYPQCLFHNVTGLYCAGCGATRAAYALLHGRLWDALHDNALFVATLPVVALPVGFHIVSAWRKNAWPELTAKPSLVAWRGAGFMALMLGFMIIRNLPGWPFEYLRPLAG